MKPEPMLSAKECAAILGMTVHTVRIYIANGLLPAVRIGPQQLRIRPEDLQEFMNKTVPTVASHE